MRALSCGTPPVRWWARVLAQLRSSIIYILLFALAFDVIVWISEGAHEWPFESIAIATILVFNTAMGVWQEYRAEDALARLRELAAPRVWVLRDGHLEQLDATMLVPGDLVRVEAGDRIPADGLLNGEQALQIDESILTGESVPVERAAGDDVFSGTLAVRIAPPPSRPQPLRPSPLPHRWPRPLLRFRPPRR